MELLILENSINNWVYSFTEMFHGHEREIMEARDNVQLYINSWSGGRSLYDNGMVTFIEKLNAYNI